MTRKEDAWDQLAAHTFAGCQKKCKTGLGSCCDKTYCDEAAGARWRPCPIPDP